MKNEDQISQYLTFTVSEENFALNVLSVREVLEFQTYVPDTQNAWIL
jgi:chemotaxis signal transduction protein